MDLSAQTEDSKGRILIVDDDLELRMMLQRYLLRNGYRVRAVPAGDQIDRHLDRERFDALILDLMLPGEDGLTACRRLRSRGETIPILMLTARGDPVDRIVGLEMGADDYLPKPFDPRELLARLHAMLRRQAMSSGAPVPAGLSVVRFGPYVLDPVVRRLTRGDAEVDLTWHEFSLLHALATQAGRPLGRERIMELAYGRDHQATDRSVDVQILRLRRIVEADPAAPRYIRTVRGTGYVFVADGDAP